MFEDNVWIVVTMVVWYLVFIQSLAEKHKELSNLEAATRQLTGDLESTRMMIDTLKKRLEEADEDNKVRF